MAQGWTGGWAGLGLLPAFPPAGSGLHSGDPPALVPVAWGDTGGPRKGPDFRWRGRRWPALSGQAIWVCLQGSPKGEGSQKGQWPPRAVCPQEAGIFFPGLGFHHPFEHSPREQRFTPRSPCKAPGEVLGEQTQPSWGAAWGAGCGAVLADPGGGDSLKEKERSSEMRCCSRVCPMRTATAVGRTVSPKMYVPWPQSL